MKLRNLTYDQEKKKKSINIKRPGNNRDDRIRRQELSAVIISKFKDLKEKNIIRENWRISIRKCKLEEE